MENPKPLLSTPNLSGKRDGPFQIPQALAFQKYDPKKFKCATQDAIPKLQLLPQIQQSRTQTILQSTFNEHPYPNSCSPTFVTMK